MRDRMVAAAVLIASAYLYGQTYTFRRAPFGSSLGPAFFPRVVLIALMALSLLLFLASGRRPGRGFASGRRGPDWREWRNPVVTFVTFGLYAWLLPTVGFVPATFLYLAGMQYLLKPRPWKAMAVPALASLAAAAALQYLFERVLEVILPHGAWM